MTSIEKVIFPGIAIGCLFLVLVASLITSPKIALAQNSAPPATQVAQKPAASGNTANGNAPGGNKGTAGSTMGQVLGVISASPEQQPIAQPTAEPQPAESGSSGAENCPLNPNYPQSILQWCGLISQYSQKNNLEPNLVAAVMLQESGGNPQAYSKSGAVGLLQVMPNDGLASGFMCVNGPCFSARPSTQQLYDPEFNIAYGTKMLADFIQKYGDIREALHAYGPINMGYRYADIILSIMNRFQ
jgi:soluble lytic murein transglycosylase-like protein